jgi:hypothetical protein
MNCKPGDLARIISDAETRAAHMADKIIAVDRLVMIEGDACWTYSGPRLYCGCGCQRELAGVDDELLRPIRGEDGDDETLTWAGKPSTVDQPVPA